MANLMLFSGGSNVELADRVADELRITLGRADVGKFSDGEVNVEIHENVRGEDVFLLQSTCSPANDSLMQLMVMADAIHRASATRVTAVIPYYGYARQDRRPRSARVPISAKVVADMISIVGIDRILTVDLHADQIQGFFNIPVDNVYGSPVLVDHIVSKQYENPIVVSPDVGGVVRARAIAKQMNDLDLAIIDKRRSIRSPMTNQSTPSKRNQGDERHWRRGRQNLHSGRRHRRHGRHALHGRAGLERRRRHQGGGLYHPPGALGTGR